MYIFAALLICCSLPHLTPRGESQTHPRPQQNTGESRADLRLPWYTSAAKRRMSQRPHQFPGSSRMM